MASNRGSFLSNMPPVTKNLLCINVLMWLATMLLGSGGVGLGIVDIPRYLGLHFWQGSDFNPVQVVSYMFLHDSSTLQGGITHLFFNMFSLWMFGSMLERVLGAKRYLFYYLLCGVGAGLVQELWWQLSWRDMLAEVLSWQGMQWINVDDWLPALRQNGQLNGFFNSMVTVGASGAVFGILLAFGMLFPNLPMYIIPFPFPIKAKWMVLGYGLVELAFGVTGAVAGVAHFAHLGGMLFGFITIMVWKRRGTIGGGNGIY